MPANCKSVCKSMLLKCSVQHVFFCLATISPFSIPTPNCPRAPCDLSSCGFHSLAWPHPVPQEPRKRRNGVWPSEAVVWELYTHHYLCLSLVFRQLLLYVHVHARGIIFVEDCSYVEGASWLLLLWIYK